MLCGNLSMSDATCESDDAPAPGRAAVRLLREAAGQLGLRLEAFCGDWVVRLIHPDGRTRLVWGYHFDLNPSAGAHVAKDKAATFEVLRAAGVASVEHRLFLRADLEGYVGSEGSWQRLLAALAEFGGDAVLKPTEGSGGAGVTRVQSPRELEAAAGTLWQRHHAICLSPYHEVQREVRHILLDGEPRIIYEKRIDAVVGDGRSTLGELLLEKLDDPRRWADLIPSAARRYGALSWDHVPAAGQRLPLAWKHNLRSARARVLEKPDAVSLHLARRAAEALGLRLCAVDVIEGVRSRVDLAGRGAADSTATPDPVVLEVNAGLMLERYVEQVEGGWETGLKLTREVLERMFAGE
jgi:glutathione synthase/RimK-type ligase-like ATP-grasp enzyme